jgi:hypothetical protein
MTPTEISAKISALENGIHIKKVDIKAQKHRLVFDFQYAKEQDLNPDRSRADSAKIKLADAYIHLANLEYELENLQDKLKTFTKALRNARA